MKSSFNLMHSFLWNLQAYFWPEEIEAAAIPPPMGGCSLYQVIYFIFIF